MIRLKQYKFSGEGSKVRENLLINPEHITAIDMSVNYTVCLKMISIEQEILISHDKVPEDLMKIIQKAYDDSL